MGHGWKVLTLALCAGFSLSASATALRYDEATDGDLEGQILAVDRGLNRITGTFEFLANQSLPSTEWLIDSDWFQLVLPERVEIKRIRLSWSPASIEPSTTLFTTTFDMVWGNDPPTSVEVYRTGRLNMLTSEMNFEPFAAAFPLTAAYQNRYQMGTSEMTLTGPSDTWIGGTVNYEWEILTATPEPGTLVLLALGLLGLGFTGRRGLH